MDFNDIIQDKEKLRSFREKVAEFVKDQGYEQNAAIIKAAAELGCELTEEQIGQESGASDNTELSMSNLNKTTGGAGTASWCEDYATMKD